MSGREGKAIWGWEDGWMGNIGRAMDGGDGPSMLVSPTGGKKKPLKQPKKQAKEMDEVRTGAEAGRALREWATGLE